ncbi:hypothetical protein ABZ920_01325 [Streptomyces sp. NPDC046831]|uniref:hypothetical protein n=1 Tax=Streptomyces sp. NPDC046831 TaxID=3154805 RepID=UPI003408BBC6
MPPASPAGHPQQRGRTPGRGGRERSPLLRLRSRVPHRHASGAGCLASLHERIRHAQVFREGPGRRLRFSFCAHPGCAGAVARLARLVSSPAGAGGEDLRGAVV